MKNRKKRFFFHFRKQTGELTLHWNKQCVSVKNIECNVPVETKWNNQQPRVVLRGFATEVEFLDDKAIIR
jgi:hypothetical protein